MMESMSNADVPGGRRRGDLGGLLLEGEADGTEQVCTDPKGCGQPGFTAPNAALDPDPSVCTDPKGCGQPGSTPGSVPQ
jgi:hypothetical protein